MARRPPVIVLADGGSPDELVKVRILLNSTLPTIRARTGHLSAELEDGRRLQQAALAARGEMVQKPKQPDRQAPEFASLERKALVRASPPAARPWPPAMLRSPSANRPNGCKGRNRRDARRQRSPRSCSRKDRRRRGRGRARGRRSSRIRLPASGRGVGHRRPRRGQCERRERTRTDIGDRRGASVTAPADGVVRFSGPFRDYDGVLIIDHGGGWMSLIVNVSSTLQPGRKVRLGDPVGQALGPLLVELSQNGRRISPALIAGSSQSLSKAAKGG